MPWVSYIFCIRCFAIDGQFVTFEAVWRGSPLRPNCGTHFSGLNALCAERVAPGGGIDAWAAFGWCDGGGKRQAPWSRAGSDHAPRRAGARVVGSPVVGTLTHSRRAGMKLHH